MGKKRCKIGNIKFDPPISSRYLPGEVEETIAKVDLETYKCHRLDLINKKPVVDNKAPKLVTDVFYRRPRLNEDSRLAGLNYKENMKIVQNMNEIFRTGGIVDCWQDNDPSYTTDQNEKKNLYKAIMKENKHLYGKINSMCSELSPQVMAKHWSAMKEQIATKSRYPLFKEVSKYPSITANAIRPTSEKLMRRTKCFFDLELSQGNLQLGRLVFELYTDYAPLVCANFEAFCRGYNGLSYKGTPFHRIISSFSCQGGDVTKFNGIGGASIYEDRVPEENYTLQHSCPGVLSAYSDDKKTFDSKFSLTFGPLRTMDDKWIVFGKIVKGLQNLYKVRAYGTKFGKPVEKVIVSNCGVLRTKPSRSFAKRQSRTSRLSDDGSKD